MNKKFSTLVATLLLSGTLFTLNATPISDLSKIQGIEVVAATTTSPKTIKFTGDVTLSGKDYILIDEDGVVIDGQNKYTLTGHIVIIGENCKVTGLTIDFTNPFNGTEHNDTDGNGTQPRNRGAIVVNANQVTITNNKITAKVNTSSPNLKADGIILLPTAKKVEYTITGNQITAPSIANKEEGAVGIALWENLKLDGTEVEPPVALDAAPSFDLSSQIKDCAVDYQYVRYEGYDGTAVNKGMPILEAVVTPNESNADAFQDILSRSSVESDITFNGTVEEFQKFVEDNKISTESVNVAVQCTGDENGDGAANVLLGDVPNPDNGLTSIISGAKLLDEEVLGHTLIEKVDANKNNYYLLIQKSYNGNNNVIYSDADGNIAYKEATTDVLEDAANDPNYLWIAYENTGLDGNYTIYFKNKAGKTFEAANKKSVNNVPYLNGVPLAKSGNGLSGTDARYYGLYKVSDKYFTANDLIERYGDYFTLGITYKDEKNKDVDVTGVFAGQLRPVSSVTYSAGEATYVDATTEQSFMLVNGEGNIIVIDTKAPLFEAPSDHGYAFTTITPKQWAERFTAATLKDHNYVAEFKLAYDYNNQSTTEAVTSIEIGSYTVGLEKQEGNIILVADVESQLLEDPTISIKLNAGNGIAAKDWLTSPSYYTVEAINKDKNAPHYGKVLGLNEWGSVDWVAPENVDLTKPEGQFAIDQTYKFTNRESGTYSWILANNQLYKVAGEDNVYALVTSNGNDTLRISPITADKYTSADGFKRFSASELNANTYTVAMKSLMGDPFIIENHNDKHRLGLNADEYTEWRIEMPTVKLMDATNDLIRLVPDTVTIETPIEYYVAGKGWQTTTATDYEDDYYAPNTALKICTYILKNTDNGEYLDGQDWSESAGNAYYVCRPKTDKKVQIATRIALKEDGDGTVNLVPVRTESSWYYAWKEGNVNYSAYEDDWTDKFGFKEDDYKAYAKNLKLSDYKILGGTSTLTGVLKDEALYKATTNDLFVIAPAEAPTYKKMEQGDKIILSLKNNTENVLVEGPKGELATISNREAHKDLNPTLYVDTAYVNRDGNYAYQYLLGVRINRVDTTYECNVPAHGTHRADTTFGYFLVNMIDSAKACTDVHNNKFVYNNEYKLDFVEGYHTNDTLFFTNEAGKVTSMMEVGNGDFNIAKYAFKMVDETEFVIETATGYTKKVDRIYNSNGSYQEKVVSVETKPGYLRWVNGNLVVTDNIDDAAHFTMEASDKEATANEAISAGNVVVAGTNGAVVVKGAEGKNVIVSTILGKVVANEVVSSDNAQIATPAGIVVVSVDGESFKVVVK